MRGLTSKREYQTQPGFNFLKQRRGQGAGSLGQKPLVNRIELRNIHNRISREARMSLPAENISGRFCEADVGCKDGDNDSLNEACVEIVGLQNQHRSPISRTGSLRALQRSPPDFTASHHQSSGLIEARCIESIRGSTPDWRKPYTRSKASRTPQCRCDFRYSASAVA